MRLLLLTILLLITSSCTVRIPDIKITGEKTALENQVMGDYARIKEDAWMVASERGSGDVKITADRSDVVEAVRDREFLKDDINEYKIKGIFGEEQSGFLGIVDKNKLDKLDSVFRESAQKAFEKENAARKLIMQRIIETDARYNSAPEEVYSAFFNMNLSESPDGTYFLNRKGAWERK